MIVNTEGSELQPESGDIMSYGGKSSLYGSLQLNDDIFHVVVSVTIRVL